MSKRDSSVTSGFCGFVAVLLLWGGGKGRNRRLVPKAVMCARKTYATPCVCRRPRICPGGRWCGRLNRARSPTGPIAPRNPTYHLHEQTTGLADPARGAEHGDFVRAGLSDRG